MTKLTEAQRQDMRPTCQVCREGGLTVLGPLIVCARCECAWAEWEYLAAVESVRRAALEEHDG